jgi:formamidopyrimidine-DNA glycosylase
MPELPEVETIRRGLAPHLEGMRIAHVALNRSDLRFPLPSRMAERLKGAQILPLQRRAKYLLIPLDTQETLVIHLGMSGRLLIEAGADSSSLAIFHHDITRLRTHDHVVLTLQDGRTLVYNDPRRFGFMLLEGSETLPAHSAFAGLGVEPLGNDFHAAGLLHALAGRRVPLKSALLDQRIIAGLGNIYVCEALHRVGLSPYRIAGSLTRHEAEELVTAIRLVLLAAIEAGGSTLRDYRQGDGALGYFQHDFRAYGQEGKACSTPACSGVIERQVQAGRSTFFCATCQK